MLFLSFIYDIQNMLTTIISVWLFILAWIHNTTESGILPGEISKQKCKVYSKEAFADQRKADCGFGRDDIISAGTYGNEARLKEFPHQALLGYESAEKPIDWACGGSMISEQYVLTVGHCLRSSYKEPPKYVKMGTVKGNDTSHTQMRTISEIILHPYFTPLSYYNDLGLVKLTKPFDLNPYTRPACLFTSRDTPMPLNKALLTRWGKDDVLHQATVILDWRVQKECNEFYGGVNGRTLKNGIQNDTQLCAKVTRDRDIGCGISSGNPLQVLHQSVNNSDDVTCMYDVIGISTFGHTRCGLGGHEVQQPDVYTKVSAYIEWIESTVWPEEMP